MYEVCVFVCVCICVYDGDIIFFTLSSENTNQTGNHPANHGASGLWVTFGGPLVCPGQESSLPSSVANRFLPATLGRSGPTYQRREGSFSPWISWFLCNLTHLFLSSAFPGSTGNGHPGSSTTSPCAYKPSRRIQEPCSNNEKLLLLFCFFLWTCLVLAITALQLCSWRCCFQMHIHIHTPHTKLL